MKKTIAALSAAAYISSAAAGEIQENPCDKQECSEQQSGFMNKLEGVTKDSVHDVLATINDQVLFVSSFYGQPYLMSVDTGGNFRLCQPVKQKLACLPAYHDKGKKKGERYTPDDYIDSVETLVDQELFKDAI